MARKDESRDRRVRPYPNHTLEQALVIAQALQDKNAGKPLDPILLAGAISRKPASSEYRILLSSSIKYGLTTGTHVAKQVQLTALGKAIVQPTTPSERASGLLRASLTPSLFRQIYEHYNRNKVPDSNFFQNALIRQFGVDQKLTADCIRILLENARYVGMLKDVSGSTFLILPDESTTSATVQADDSSLEPEMAPPTSGVQGDDYVGSVPMSAVERHSPGTPTTAPAANRKIFVAHGKSRKPLEQLERILAQFKIPYVVATEEPHQGRPISQKVAELMRECNSAILIFTADVEFKDAQGDSVWRPAENVVYELGAASVLYDNRVVVFKEDPIEFPTNFRDLGYIPFSRDQLESKAMDLMKELIGLGLVRISAA
ncbi:MAG: TIR domain-containing protein [Bacillota bacterium]